MNTISKLMSISHYCSNHYECKDCIYAYGPEDDPYCKIDDVLRYLKEREPREWKKEKIEERLK